jgi:ChrB-like protein
MDSPWLLFIYTVPAEPSRKRAYVWREVKKLGAVYLRDGVCLLPERPDTLAAAEAIAHKVEEFEGQATVVTAARLEPARAEAVLSQFQAARAEEYSEIVKEAERLLEHVARETEHRAFTFAELEELEQDLSKLKRWLSQVQERDYFPSAAGREAGELLQRADTALATFVERAAEREVSAS